MRIPLTIAIAMGLMLPTAAPVFAQNSRPALYEFNGKQYETLAACQRAKKRAKARGAIAGAVLAGTVGAATPLTREGYSL